MISTRGMPVGDVLVLLRPVGAGPVFLMPLRGRVAAQLAFRSRPPRWSILSGLALLIVSLGLVLAGFLTEVFSIFAAVGTTISGPAPGSVSSGAPAS